jgi:hypothetical protein
LRTSAWFQHGPGAALAPLNPIRGILAFSEFQYAIRTVLAGQVYEMANTPRLYIPIYILIRIPLPTLFGAVLAILFTVFPRAMAGAKQPLRRDIALTLSNPLACQVALQSPAFTGLRHFLFIIPALTILAAIGLDTALTALAMRGRVAADSGLAIVTACFAWNAVILVRLHPYEYLFYNTVVGGLEGASRRYDLDHWFGSMPEVLNQLESYLRRTEPVAPSAPAQVYSVAVCGKRPAFEKAVTLPQLRWDFKPTWEQSDFFICADSNELRPRRAREGNRHRRTARRYHRVPQRPSGVDPTGRSGRTVNIVAKEPMILNPATPLPASKRELRIDLFRGLALWLFFINHLSPSVLSWFTLRTYGFSDAAEFFISGYKAALVYAPSLSRPRASCGEFGKSTSRMYSCSRS